MSFSPFALKNLRLKNRFVRSATAEGMCPNGFVEDQLVAFYENLAQGHLGLIITSHTAVSLRGLAHIHGQMRIDSDDTIPGLHRLVEACHKHETPILLQLAHAGPAAENPLTLFPDYMTPDDFTRLREEFVQGARRAQEAGFDGIELHAAHGYLFSQILSGCGNHRTDGYGGSVEKRASFVCEVMRGIRAQVGPEYPIVCKINAEDFKEGGNTIGDTFTILTMLQEAGLDAVELSGGFQRLEVVSRLAINPARPSPDHPEGYHGPYAAELRRLGLRIPMMVVGGIRSREKADELVESGAADLVSISRALVCEPHFVAQIEADPKKTAKCVSNAKMG